MIVKSTKKTTRAKATSKKATKATSRSAKSVTSRTKKVTLDAASQKHIAMIQELAKTMKTHSLTALELTTNSATFKLETGQAPVHTAVSQKQIAASADERAPASEEVLEAPVGHEITSPFVGTFYRRPNPDADIYAEVGDVVSQGQILCIVEAMKLMNEIESDVDGKILEVLAQDGQPIEYGQPLFRIETK